MRKMWVGLAAVFCSVSLTLTGCSSSSSSPSSPSNAGSTGSVSATSVDKATAAAATSVKDFGGLDGLIAAAKAEGQINVIALPDNWANYGNIKKNFEAKYGIKVNSILPDASSKEEIQAADANKGTDKAPDVFDLGINVASSSKDYFTPYKVAQWDQIPDANKEASGLYYADYTGIMSVGYNATKYGEVNSLDQLTDPKFAGSVALNGKPAEAGAAFNGFLMVNNAMGGTFSNLQPGIDYFKKLKAAGTLNLKDVTSGTIDAGEHGVVFDWTYNQVATTARLKDKGVDWKVFVPKGGELAAYYNQAVSKDAPHPAAARLWMEYLYSADGSNEWLRGGATPVLYKWLQSTGKLDKAAADALPKLEGDPKTPTKDEADKATAFLQENWNKAVG